MMGEGASWQAEAVIFNGNGTATLGMVELPPLDPDDVLIETTVSVISAGTEGWVLSDRFRWGGPLTYPLVPGYQKMGNSLDSARVADTAMQEGDEDDFGRLTPLRATHPGVR